MASINFNDTQNAFSYKSNNALIRDYQIFRLINQSWLVKFGIETANRMMDMGIKAPVTLGMKPTVYAVFCGGNTLSEATKKIQQLYQHKVKCILDYGVEGKESEEDFARTESAIKEAILFAKNNEAVNFVSSKFTGLIPFSILEKLHAKEQLSATEQEVFRKAKDRIYSISKLAYDNNVRLFVDAEESWIQQPLDDLTFELMQQFNREKPIIYNTVQLYRKDRFAFLKTEAERAKREGIIYAVKLVRGAYMEKEAVRAKALHYENPIQNSKENTDADYNAAVAYAIANINHIAVCVATHNEQSTQLAINKMEEMHLPNQHPNIHFSQLLGMSDQISFNVANSGYNVSKYMPYGPVGDVIPYLIRRAQENTSVSGQMSRELKLLKQEIKRRKLFVL